MFIKQALLKPSQAYKVEMAEGVFQISFYEENECAVYNQLTGNTHLIDGMGAEIFKIVSESPSTRGELLQKLINVFELPDDFDVEGFLDKLIVEYQKLGLLAVMVNSPA